MVYYNLCNATLSGLPEQEAPVAAVAPAQLESMGYTSELKGRRLAQVAATIAAATVA
jgi:hypothetical protein